MKNTVFILIGFILFSLTGITQNEKFSGYNELMKFKKERFSNSNSGYGLPDIYSKTLTPETKSVQDDYGNPPDWSWVTTFGGSGKDVARKVAIASDGSLFVVGSFSGEMSINWNNYSSVGRHDGFLAKFYSNGTLIWFHQFSPEAGESIDINDIHLDASGKIYFTGYYSGDVSFGSFNLSGVNGKNLFIAAANPEGEITMAVTHTTINPEELGLKVDVDASGNIYVLGSTDGTTSRLHPSVIIKYSSEGTQIMDYYHNQNFCDMTVFGEHIYFSGTINSPDFIGDFYFDPVSYGDAFVAKSDLSFDFIWAEMANHANSGDSFGIALYVSPDEDLFLAGFFRNDVIWDLLEYSGIGGYVAKCSAEGDFIWLEKTSEMQYEQPIDITGNEANIFVTYYNNQYATTPFIQLKSFDILTGMPGIVYDSEYKIESINYSAINNGLVLTEDADEQIQLAMLDENSLIPEWSNLFGGNSASAYGIGMGIDQYGFQYNYGYASNKINYFGTTINKGLYLAKQDGGGNTLWVVQFPGNNDMGNNDGNFLEVDTLTNSVYFTGLFFNPLVIPGGPTLIPDVSGSVFLLKYNFDGNYQWAIQENVNSSLLSFSSDNSGNILLCGLFDNTFSVGNIQLNSAGSSDVFIIKYDTDGEVVWAKRAGGEDVEYIGLISTDGQDNVYLTGEFDSYDVTVDDYPITLEEGDGNILLAKFDSMGNVEWVTVKGGTNISWGDYYGWPTGILTDLDGNSYIKGWHADSAAFDNIMLSSVINKPNYNNKWNKFIAKFDTDGNTIWAKSISELTGSMDYNQFDVDQSGNVYSGLRIRDTTYFGNDFMYVNAGRYDLLIVNYTNDGQLNWVKAFENGESGTTWISSVKAYDVETIAVCGWFSDYLDFGTTSFEVNNKNGFIGILGETTGITVYQRKEETILFDLFPNPANQKISILLNGLLPIETDLLICDIAGKKLYSETINKNKLETSIDLAGFSPGVYILKLKSGEKMAIKKFVVE